MGFHNGGWAVRGRFRRRRAVSEVVAVLLLVAIVVGMGIVVYGFANGSIGTTAGSFGGLVSSNGNADAERFSVEQATFHFGGSTATGIDGTATNQATGSSASIAATLTTSDSNDVVVAYVSPADTGATAPPSVASVSGGGLTWTHRVTSPTENFVETAYVPVTITNSQTGATPTPLQEMVTWDPATYATYEATNLGNVRFCTSSSCSTELYAWLESCSSTCSTSGSSSTSAVAWVKLTSSIAGSGGTLTIYLVFEPTLTNFDDNYWGEAPNLSPTYAQYDNGANVFTAYFNGNTATADFSMQTGMTVAQATGVTGPGATTINAIQITGTAPAHDPFFSFNQAITNAGLMVESSFTLAADTNDATGISGLMNSATATSITNGISVGMGDGTDYFFQGTDIGGTVNIPINGAGTAPAADTWLYSSITYTGTGAASWYAQITPALYGTPGQTAATGYSGTDTVANPLSAATDVYLGSIGGFAAVNIEYNFMRARAYPPSGVLPTAALGSTTTTTATDDVEEWYAIASSPLSSTTITATLSTSDTAATWMAVFGASGVDTVSPFDANAAVPATASGTSPSTTMSTSNADDLLLYACAAEAGSMAAGFASVYSTTYPPTQNEYVGYDLVATTQSSLATSCGTNAYGAEITDALVGFPGGATLNVANLGSVSSTLASVYIVDQSTNTFVEQIPISLSLGVGSLIQIPYTTLVFAPSPGSTYSFKVTSSLGNGATLDAEAP